MNNPERRVSWLHLNARMPPVLLSRWCAGQLLAIKTPAAAAAVAEVLADAMTPQWTLKFLRNAVGASTDQALIDAVCRVWHRSGWHSGPGSSVIGDLIRDNGWVASDPTEVRFWTAAHSGRLDLLAASDPAMTRTLAKLADVELDEGARDQARATLRALTRADSRDALCELAIMAGSPTSLEVAIDGGFRSTNKVHEAVLLFLAGDFTAYSDLDFDGALLRTARTVAHQTIRVRLAQRAREHGRIEWLSAVTDQGPTHHGEWEPAIDLLTSACRWEELWQLVRRAPPVWSAQILRRLARADWQPAAADRAGYAQLVELAVGCPATVPIGSEFREDEAAGEALRFAHATSVRSSNGDCDEIVSMALTPDGTRIALGLWRGGNGIAAQSGGLCLLDVTSGAEVARPRLIPGGAVDRAALTNDGLFVTSHSGGRSARLWDPSTGHQVGVIAKPDCTGLAPTSDGSALAGVTSDGLVLWDVSSGDRISSCDRTLINGRDCSPKMIRPEADVRLVCPTPGGSILAVGNVNVSSKLVLYRIPSGRRIRILDDGGVWAMAVTADGRFLVTARMNSRARIWRLPEGRLIGELDDSDELRAVSVTPEGNLLGVYQNASELGLWKWELRLWNVPSGKLIRTFGPPSNRIRRCTAGPVVSRTGVVVLAAGDTVLVWRSPLAETVFRPLRRAPDTFAPAPDAVPAEQSWVSFVNALADWPHRFDVELGDTDLVQPTDIELGPDP